MLGERYIGYNWEILAPIGRYRKITDRDIYWTRIGRCGGTTAQQILIGEEKNWLEYCQTDVHRDNLVNQYNCLKSKERYILAHYEGTIKGELGDIFVYARDILP